MDKNLFTQQSSSQLKDLLDEINICIFTTSDFDDRKNCSGIMSTTKVDEDGNIWFFTSKKSKRIAEIRANDAVHLLYTHPGKKNYVDVWGNARLIEDEETISALWDPALNVWFPEGKNNASYVCLIKVEPKKAHYWDNTTNQSVDFFKSLSSTEMIREQQPSVA